MSRWMRMGLCLVLAMMALLLAGSIHPEKTAGRTDDPAFAAAGTAVRAMASGIPFAHRSEWEDVACRKPLLLFRCDQD